MWPWPLPTIQLSWFLRRGRSVHQAVEANVAHLALPARFSGIAIRSGQLVAEAPGLAERLRAAADNEGLRLTAWAVVCHNSELACRYPGSALENCFGDRSTHGLCPSHPSVRQYILELCTGILETGIFDELFVESVAYMLAGHGHPHELWAVRDDPATRYFRSLCFCQACLELGNRLGCKSPRRCGQPTMPAWTSCWRRSLWPGAWGSARSVCTT